MVLRVSGQWQAHLAAAALLAGGTGLYHLPALVAGLVPIQDDVVIFFYPLLVATSQALSKGTLPLWSPSIFGGYPLFADGEAGAAYPFHLLILPWTSPETALVVLRLLHTFLAGVFTYSLLRTLGAGWLGGVIAGVAYAFSGFAAAQAVHLNVAQSIVWLPLQLALAERALRAAGWSRVRLGLLLGGAVGIQALASHVHVTIMSAMALTAFIAYRGVTRPVQDVPLGMAWLKARSATIGGAAALLMVVGVVGVGLSAIQLVPLGELAAHTYRAQGLDPAFAAANSVWPPDLVTLLLPRLHDTAIRDSWGPWIKWEWVLYVGILPLVCAAIGLLAPSRRYRPFFGGLGACSILLALGPYAPLPLWDTLHALPGFEALRSPGRFSLLLSLAIAVLAGYGVDWLVGRRRPSTRTALEVIVGGSLVVAAAGLALEKASAELRTAPTLVADYLALPGVPGLVDGTPLTAERLSRLAADAVSVANPATAWQLALVLASGLVLALWLASGPLRPVAVVMTGAIVFVDLWVFTLSFHPYGRIGDLEPTVPAVLLQRAEEPFRVYNPPTIFQKLTQVEPNRLLAKGLQEAEGYSSLQPDRHLAYITAVEYSDNHLLDLLNARYVVVRRDDPILLPSHAGTSFHPQRPLFSGKRDTPGAGGALLPDGGPARADTVRLMASLWDAESIADGSVVARLHLRSPDGPPRVLDVVAGRDLSDATVDVPGRTRRVAHGRAKVAFRYQREDPSGDSFGEQLYYAELPIVPPTVVTELTVEHTGHSAGLQVYGVGLWDQATGEVTQADRKAKYREVYRDQDVLVYENTSALPRAFLVGRAVVAEPGQDVLARMLDGPFDPRQMVFLEPPIPGDLRVPAGGPAPAGPAGVAHIDDYRDQEVVIRTTAEREAVLVLTDPYFPGWVAFLDGRPAPILRANYLFRAVVVPAGSHTIRFSYQPGSVALGALITLGVAALILTVAALHAYAGFRRWDVARRGLRREPMPEPVYAVGAGPLEG